jgi:addiction module HigA family antidote
MPMKEPPHPGLSVRHECLEPLGLSVTEAAKVLGVSRQALNSLVNGKGGISPEMAIRLDKAFGGTADAWFALQNAYDLAQARKLARNINVKRYFARQDPREARRGQATSRRFRVPARVEPKPENAL